MRPPGERLAVVIATYRRPQGLARLLDCLRAQGFPEDRLSVVVVNDGSHDPRYARVLARHAAWARYVSLPRRGGPSRARNAGARSCGGDALVFTDDDCEPPRDWLRRLSDALDRFPAAAAVGGPVSGLAGRAGGLVERYLTEIGYQGPWRPSGRVAGLCTANLAVRRGWFERVGGFDERLPYAGGEDFELCRRLLEAGGELAWAVDWLNRHRHPSSPWDLCRRFFFYGYGAALSARHRGGPLPDGLPRAASIPRFIASLPQLLRDARAPLGAELDRDQPLGRLLAFHSMAVLRVLSFQTGGLCAMRGRPFRDGSLLRLL
ncbi:MAG: glycosyltransferase [Elusimicrobia bacterium]|nr:glycosyltransferase [Elusimicrobiota bacterium]